MNVEACSSPSAPTSPNCSSSGSLEELLPCLKRGSAFACAAAGMSLAVPRLCRAPPSLLTSARGRLRPAVIAPVAASPSTRGTGCSAGCVAGALSAAERTETPSELGRTAPISAPPCGPALWAGSQESARCSSRSACCAPPCSPAGGAEGGPASSSLAASSAACSCGGSGSGCCCCSCCRCRCGWPWCCSSSGGSGSNCGLPCIIRYSCCCAARGTPTRCTPTRPLARWPRPLGVCVGRETARGLVLAPQAAGRAKGRAAAARSTGCPHFALRRASRVAAGPRVAAARHRPATGGAACRCLQAGPRRALPLVGVIERRRSGGRGSRGRSARALGLGGSPLRSPRAPSSLGYASFHRR